MTFLQFINYIFLLIFAPNRLVTLEYRMFRLLNKDRKTHGLKKLFFQYDLRKLARLHSKDMAKKDYFAHVNPNGESHVERMKDMGITDVTSGENLAKLRGYPDPCTSAEIGLMNSPGHRANILNTHYNVVGIGLIKSENGTYYFTQNFAYRDLVLTGFLPKRVKINKILSLNFRRISKIDHFYLKVEDVAGKELLFRRLAFSNDKLKFSVKMEWLGKVKFSVYRPIDAKSMSLVNEFEVDVKRSFWDLF